MQQRISLKQTNAVVHKSARSGWEIIRENVFTIFNVILFSTLVALMLLTFVPLPDEAGVPRIASPGVRMAVFGDVLFTGISVFLNMVIGMVQEFRAKRDLDKLAKQNIRKARVLRNGALCDVPVDNIVLDDLIELTPGDRIPADGTLLNGEGIEVDESLLTGESDNIHKVKGETVISGSFCVVGRGLMKAEQVGLASYANQLTQIAVQSKDHLTPLQKKINVVVQLLVAIMVVVAVLELISAFNRHTPVLDALRFTTVIVGSFVPSGLVLAITVSLAAGAVRISREGTLVQRVSAVESMGNVTVLCVDKTGTLTQNKLTVTEVVPLCGAMEAEARHMLALYAGNVAAQNGTARAIATYAGSATTELKLGELPFSSARKTGVVMIQQGAGSLCIALGAPEYVIPPGHAEIHAQVRLFQRQGLRVVALSTQPGPMLESFDPASGKPICLVVIEDQLRPDIVETMRMFDQAGVRVKIISGDNADTVQAIAVRLGMHADRVVTQTELASMDTAAFAEAAQQSEVFARITPEYKKLLVASLTQQGEYVAMVGDGVNDVPALKQARLGIAMNDGAQITRDVAELVLLNNNLSTLPHALFEGQAITQKILASAKLYLAKNAVTILAILFAGFVGLEFPAAPRLVSWIVTISVGIPCFLLALGVVKPNHTRDVAQGVLLYSIIAGAVGAVILVVSYIIANSLANVVAARTVFGLATLHFAIHIFWDVFGVSIFTPASIRHHPREFFIGLILLAVGIFVPTTAPRGFGAQTLTWLELLNAAVLPLIGAFVFNRLLYGSFMRSAIRTLRT